MNENIFNKLATWLSAWQHQNLYENLMNEIIFIWQDRNIFVYNIFYIQFFYIPILSDKRES